MEQALSAKAVDLQEWEAAEIKRSAFEASQTNADRAALLDTESNIARYLNPPADTPYPLEYAFHLLGDARGRLVVDFGCGTGENSLLLAKRGAQVQAVDISPDLIAIAQTRLAVNGVTEGVTFHTASVYEIPVADASVDIVFGMAILHHLELPLAAREVLRILKPGGRAIFKEPVRNSKVLRFVRNLIPYRAPDLSPFERPLLDSELLGMGVHFRHCRIRSFYLPYVGLARILPGVKQHLMAIARFDHRLMQSLPWLEPYATVKVIELVK
jgi:2-polyprenyl-3-methyl-5-hydroxy-6-metoxy-1,4-benzoquinol methylase